MIRLAFVALMTAGGAWASTLDQLSAFGASEVRGAFLARGGGARPAGMGEAFSALADDASAISWNPAGLGRLDAGSVVAMYESSATDRSASYLAGATPMGGGVIGAAISVVSYGTYEVRDEAGAMSFTDSLTDSAAVVAWAWENPAWVGSASWGGISLEVVKDAAGGSLVGGSAGWSVAWSPRLSTAIVIQHAGPKVDGFGLPMTGKAGAAYGVMSGLNLAVDAGYGLGEGELQASAGVEWSFLKIVTLRGGYRWLSQDQALGGMTGVAAGAGIKLGGLRIDYAYQPFGELATSHRIALVYAGTRAPASRRAPQPMDEPRETPAGDDTAKHDRLFREAMESYNTAKYDAALAKARDIVKANPDHWLAWQLVGNCLYAKGDRTGAMDAYDRSLKIHPDNPKLREWSAQVRRVPE